MMADGHLLMVPYHIAVKDSSGVEDIIALIDSELDRFGRNPTDAYTYLQYQYTLLCLSIEDERAKHILALPAHYGDIAAFEIHLNARLRKLIGAEDVELPKTRKLDSLEAVLPGV